MIQNFEYSHSTTANRQKKLLRPGGILIDSSVFIAYYSILFYIFRRF